MRGFCGSLGSVCLVLYGEEFYEVSVVRYCSPLLNGRSGVTVGIIDDFMPVGESILTGETWVMPIGINVESLMR